MPGARAQRIDDGFGSTSRHVGYTARAIGVSS
jgi:hypothetical protein